MPAPAFFCTFSRLEFRNKQEPEIDPLHSERGVKGAGQR